MPSTMPSSRRRSSAKVRRTRKAGPGTQAPAGGAGISLSEIAYRAIRERILKGELPLGSPLFRRKLSAELGMSLLPVSEALNRLENEALVESRARIGTRVRHPSGAEIQEHFKVREALETQAARLFAEKASAREREELRGLAEEMDALFNRCLAGEDDPQSLYRLRSHHLRLHLRIAECTGCHALRRILERTHTLVFTWLLDIAARRPPLPPRHHRDLIAAISSGSPEEADAAMRRHIREGLASILRALVPAASPAPFRRRERPASRR